MLAENPRMPGQTNQRLLARLDLLDAETHWLLSDFEHATTAARGALAVFTACDDAAGCADAHGILASVHSGRGDLPQRDQCLVAAVEYAVRIGDAQRVGYFEAKWARYAVLRDVRQSNLVWGQRFAEDVSGMHPAVAASIHSYFATRDYSSGNFARAVVQFDKAFEAASLSGQLLVAVVATVNAGNTYAALNEHDAALECLQRGLELARTTGWAVALGPCLHQMAEIMGAMGRLDAAQSMLDEAMQIYVPLRQTDQVIEAQTGVADALLLLGDDAQAEEIVVAALRTAQHQGAAILEVSAQRLLARVHASRGNHMAAMECLVQALAAARKVDGYLIFSELLLAVAEQYAQAGHYAKAYQHAVLAGGARERVLKQEASNRATAMQVRMDTERARAESQFHRRQAEAEACRATVLQQSSETLELLGSIGQEITSQRDKEHVFVAIERHMHGLLDASSFSI